MRGSKPLSLKRQRSSTPSRAKSFEFVVEVILDLPAFHLVDTFTYGIPTELSEEVKVGSRVKVTFNGISLEKLQRATERA